MNQDKDLMLNYETEQRLNYALSGVDAEVNGTSMGVLQSIQAIYNLDKGVAAGNMPNDLKNAYKAERDLIGRALFAVQDSPELGQHFGKGLKGALSLAPYLRQKEAQMKAGALISKYALTPADEAKIAQSRRGFS